MSGRRYLTSAEAAGALRRGAQIEQFLGRGVEPDGRTAIRWLTASGPGRAFSLTIHEVEDVGSDDFLDVSEFPPLDDEEYTGEGRMVASADDPVSLLREAGDHGADAGRWVNDGIVQDEYRDSRSG